MVGLISQSFAVVGVIAVSYLLCAAVVAQPAPDERKYDVIVYGGTAGGVIAAVAAAREDASVLLLEPGEHLGGMVSGGLGATDIGIERVIGGVAREFFERMGAHYGQSEAAWRHEPHVAEATFEDMIKDAGVTVVFNQQIREEQGVVLQDRRIVSLTTDTGDTYTADVFIDASYEGDLMAQAGVSYTIGRESTEQYGEERAGVRPTIPMKKPGIAYDDQGMLPDIAEASGPVGSADKRIMSYTFRLCMTRDPENRVPFTHRPQSYDARRYVLLLENFASKPDLTLGQVINLAEVPNGKTDTNNKPGVNISTNLHNGSWDYPEASYERRAEIWEEHERYVRGLLYFLATDERVPATIRAEANEWGLAKDEFTENNNWPHQLYVRVGRRMLGTHVMTQVDLTEELAKPDSIALGSYFMDSHRVARVLLPDGDVATEGGVGGNTLPYEISYQSITPKAEECRNLLVPVCMSSSGVAWCSIRMEPQFMIMGHSAGVAAAIAAQQGVDVQDVPYNQLETKLLAQGQVLDHTLSPSADMKGIVVDDVDMEFRGNWVPATSASKFIGPRYLHDGNNRKGESAVRFVPKIPSDGLYAVRLHFMPHPNRARNVPVTIRAADGAHHYQLDQRTLPEGEMSRYIGTHRFDGGNAGSVILSNTGTDGYVTIDAVQFIPVKAPLPNGLTEVDAPEEDQEQGWSVRLIGMKGQPTNMAEIDVFYPCFDEFGQYIHRDWPAKIHDQAELKHQHEQEQAQLAGDSGPQGWSRFGGFADGPKLEATGFFRTQKHDGRWWIVDPEGYLFFSHGVNCVRKMDPTPIERREDWFAGKPWEQPEMKPFVLTDVSSVKYDFGGTKPLSFNFTWANLQRKYGSDWDEQSGQTAHRRLRSWGFNTIGNWSHEPTYLMRQTPYTMNLGFSAPSLAGSPRSFRDPFDPRYAEAIVERLKAEKGKSLHDPWCLGYFVDNELPWGGENALGVYTLQSPADQPAKLAMLEDLKAKYRTIAALNKAWETKHASWDALLADTTAPETTAAVADQEAFHSRYARTYFQTTRAAIRSVTPNALYLGSRFHTRNNAARKAAAEFCDIVSYNTYADTPDATLDDFDVPMMITEYSFGATDVGLFYGGGNEVKTQADRVAGYEQFVEHALAHPSVVGAHWFQYTDQPASGRTLEGENGQYGLVDLADTPYAELVEATRHFADRLYNQLLK